MKKILMVLPVFALAMALALPAMALPGPGPIPPMFSDDDLMVRSENDAFVISNTTATSNTGLNHTLMNFGGGNIVTGAAGALAVSELGVNSNMTVGTVPCDCYDDVAISSKNHAFVLANTAAYANTGDNATMFNIGGFLGGGNVMTGSAISEAGSWTIVNSNVTALGGGYELDEE